MTGSAKRPRTDDSDQAENSIWMDIPKEVQSDIVETIRQALKNRSTKPRKKSGNKGTCNDLQTFAQSLCSELLPFYRHSHCGADDASLSAAIFDTNEILACFSGIERRSAKGIKDVLNPQQKLEIWAANNFRLVQKAVRVYSMLDVAGKGCIVPEDVYRTIGELQITGNVSGTVSRKESATTFDDVLEIMAEFSSNAAILTDETEVLLSCYDIIRIARLINL